MELAKEDVTTIVDTLNVILVQLDLLFERTEIRSLSNALSDDGIEVMDRWMDLFERFESERFKQRFKEEGTT